jgi:hypothetical protein
MVQQAKNEVHVGDGESPMTSAQNLSLNRAIIDLFSIAPPLHRRTLLCVVTTVPRV